MENIIWEREPLVAKFKVWDKVSIELDEDERDFGIVTNVTVWSDEVTYIVNGNDYMEQKMDFANEYEIREFFDKPQLN